MTVYTLSVPKPHTLAFPADDYIGRRIVELGMPREHFALKALAALVPLNGTVVDVGANSRVWLKGGRAGRSTFEC